MADNVTITQGTGTTVGTDDVGGIHIQKVKLVDGTADSSAAIPGDATNGLDVDVTRVQGNVTVVQTTATSLKVDASGVAVPVTDNASTLSVDDGAGSLTVDYGSGTFVVGDGGGAISVDDNGASLTIDGTVTANAGTGTFTVGDGGSAISVDDNAGSLTVDGTVSVSGTVTVDSELPTAAGLGDAASATPTTTTLAAVPLLMNATTLDRQRAVVAALDSVGTGIAASGLVGQLDDTATASVTENQFAPVRISSRRYLLIENVQTVSATDTLGATPFFNSALTNTVINIKTSAGNLYGWYIGNTNSAVTYVQIFNLAAINVTLGTTTPSMSLEIPATSAANLAIPFGAGFSTAISIAATTTATGSTAPTSSLVVNFFYK